MRKNDYQHRLDLISQIPLELIEKAAINRYKLFCKLHSVSHKPPFFSRKLLTSAIAAMLILTIGGIVAFYIGRIGMVISPKQVPVYEGMTVSATLPSLNLAEYNDESIGMELLAYNQSELSRSELPEKLSKKQNLFDIPSSPQMYYAYPYQDIYITVHLSNPDNFEILSFTLNGVKYSSYMFEHGSDMENLILKCNVGNAAGIIEYSIDAVKYVDGESIKDVRMEGDRTVKVGVYTDEQPTATIGNVFSSFESVTFTVTAFDSFGLVEMSGGKFYAMLYEGEKIIYQQEISAGTSHQITWSKLSSNTQYQCVVIGIYDALDGNGPAIHQLAYNHFSTTDVFSFSEIRVDHHSINFNSVWAKDYLGERVLQSLTLYDTDTIVRHLPNDTTVIEDLLADHTYRLVAVYMKDGQEITVTQEFTTSAYELPQISVHCSNYYPDRVEFDVSVSDSDDIGSLTQIELLDENLNIIQIGTPDVRCFEGLECPTTYTVRVTYSYDLKDGNGARILQTNLPIVTQSEGLAIRNGKVTGMGSCTDRELYINMSVEAGAFRNTNITKVVFGSNATTIGGAAFRSCLYLHEVILAEGVKTIDSYAFYFSTLKYPLHIPASVTAIGGLAIQTEATVPIYCAASKKPAGWSDSWSDAKEKAVWNVNHLRNDEQGLVYAVLNDNSLIVVSFDNSIDTIVLPEGVNGIGPFVFRESRLKQIVFPSSVRSIGAQAFAHCSKLKTAVLNEGLISMDNYAFAYCDALEEIIIPSSIQTLGYNIFLDCISLTTVTLPEGMTSIPYQFLTGCSSLTTVNIPSTVTSIEEAAFNGCEQLTTIVLPEGLLTIKQEAFTCCYNLRNIVIPESVETIDWMAFDGNYNDRMNIFLKTDRTPSKFSINWRDFEFTTAYFGFKEWYTDEDGVRYACFKDGSKMVVE